MNGVLLMCGGTTFNYREHENLEVAAQMKITDGWRDDLNKYRDTGCKDNDGTTMLDPHYWERGLHRRGIGWVTANRIR
jgi:hypothetical protein